MSETSVMIGYKDQQSKNTLFLIYKLLFTKEEIRREDFVIDKRDVACRLSGSDNLMDVPWGHVTLLSQTATGNSPFCCRFPVSEIRNEHKL